MEPLNTFWKVIRKIPYLNHILLKLLLWRREWWDLELRKREWLEMKQREPDLREMELQEMKLREMELEVLRKLRKLRKFRELEMRDLDLSDLRKLRELELDLISNLMTQKSSVEIKQKSHIKGWVTHILPEDWCGELEALRYEWFKADIPEPWIEIMTSFNLLTMFKADLQIKVENILLPKKKQR